MRSRTTRWLLIVLGVVVALVVVAVAGVFILSRARLSRRYTVTVPAVTIPTDPAAVERGRHLVSAITKCVDCHGENLAGKVFIEAPPFRIVGRNLTRGRGGVGGDLHDKDWVRAIRYGVGRNGRILPFMPAEDYVALTDVDLAAVIAYAKSVPPVDNVLPPTQFRFLGRLFLAVRVLPPSGPEVVDTSAPFPVVVPQGATREYGYYLAQVGGCLGCHGPGLSGGPVPGVPPDFPPAANITPAGAIGQWSEADFFRALREGKRPNGAPINPFMPWMATAKMTDDETRAVWLYLRSVPPKPYGNR